MSNVNAGNVEVVQSVLESCSIPEKEDTFSSVDSFNEDGIFCVLRSPCLPMVSTGELLWNML